MGNQKYQRGLISFSMDASSFSSLCSTPLLEVPVCISPTAAVAAASSIAKRMAVNTS